MPQSSTVNIGIAGELTAALDLEAVSSKLAKSLTLSLSDGSGANQASQIFSDTRTLAASTNENLDLNGPLLNALGQAVALTKVRFLAVFAAAANVNDVIVGGAASNGFISPFGAATDTVKVKPGGCFLLAAPDANGLSVTAATADLLKIANGGAGSTVTYDIIVIGS